LGFSLDQSRFSPVSAETPSRLGPRNCGQSAARVYRGSQRKTKNARTRSRSIGHLAGVEGWTGGGVGVPPSGGRPAPPEGGTPTPAPTSSHRRDSPGVAKAVGGAPQAQRWVGDVEHFLAIGQRVPPVGESVGRVAAAHCVQVAVAEADALDLFAGEAPGAV